jgi:proteasome lid subunit RPN8/RPN11
LIVLSQRHYQAILQHCLGSLPNEACGLLGGTVDKGQKTVCSVHLLTNVDNSPEHFSMDPKQQFSAVKEMRTNGWTLLGNFHSHPASPARPSAEDKRLAFDPEASYLILSLAESAPVLKSFKLQTGIVTEEKVSIVEEEH